MKKVLTKFKPIKFKLTAWTEIKSLADILSAERQTPVSLPSAVMEAIKFFKDHRNGKTDI